MQNELTNWPTFTDEIKKEKNGSKKAELKLFVSLKKNKKWKNTNRKKNIY